MINSVPTVIAEFSADTPNYYHLQCEKLVTTSKRCFQCKKLYDYIRKRQAATTTVTYVTLPAQVADQVDDYIKNAAKLQSNLLTTLETLSDVLKKTSTPQDFESKLFNLLQQVYRQYPDFSDSFLSQFLVEQLEALVSGFRGHRWSQPMLEFAETLRYFGGKRMVDILRGQQNRGIFSTSRTNDLSRIGLMFPANSTLNEHRVPGIPYSGLQQHRLKNLKSHAANAPNGILYGGIVSDEIEIMKGLVYSPRTVNLN